MNKEPNANVASDATTTTLAVYLKDAWTTLLAGFLGCMYVLPLSMTNFEPYDGPAADQAPRMFSPEMMEKLLLQKDVRLSGRILDAVTGALKLSKPQDKKPGPFAWQDITFDELVRHLRILQIPVDCTLLFEVCGGRVFIDTKNRTAWSEGIRPGISIILGTYGIGYGTVISGQSLSRSLQRQERMEYLTWDEAMYRPAGQEEFLPLEKYFYFHGGLLFGLDTPFSRYCSLKTAARAATDEDLDGNSGNGSEGLADDMPEALNGDGKDIEIEAVKMPGLEGCSREEISKLYFLMTDLESLAHRVYVMQREIEIRNETNVTLPTMEEIKERDESIGNLPVQSFMDPSELASELKRILFETIKTLLDHKEFFINWKKGEKSVNGYVPYGNIDFASLITYMMFGFGGQSAETSSVSFFPHLMPGSVSIRKARWQIRAEGMEFFFTEFSRNLRNSKKVGPLLDDSLWDYILLAVDGTSINVPHNPKDPDTLCRGAHGSEYNQIHALCVYGVLSGIYHGVIATGKKKADEREALLTFINNNEHLSCKVDGKKRYLIVADRGFESWEILARLHMLGVRFVIRIKDSHSNGILSNYDLDRFEDQFEQYIRIAFRAKGRKGNAVDNAKPVSFLSDGMERYEMVLRVVQVRLKSDKLEALITNIPTWELSALQLVYIYNKRWEVETSFRTLKHQFNLKYFHARSPRLVRQELWAKMVMFNFCSLLMTHTAVPEAKWSKGRKYDYEIKRSWGIALCMQFIKGTIDAGTLGRKLVMNLQPIRPDRNYTRKVRSQSAMCFNYRAVG